MAKPKVESDPGRFDEAIAAFRRRVPISNEDFDLLDEVAKQRAFTVANVAQADIIADTYDAIDRAIEQGLTLEEFKAEVAEKLFDAWGSEDAYRVETIFRTNVATAYNDGRWKQINDPDVVEAFPYWRFDGIDDTRQSDICQKADNTIRPAKDPWWSQHKPPLHPNCRSTITPLDEETARDEGIDTRAPVMRGAAKPVEGFGLAPVEEQFDEWQPDLERYSSELRKDLERRLRR